MTSRAYAGHLLMDGASALAFAVGVGNEENSLTGCESEQRRTQISRGDRVPKIFEVGCHVGKPRTSISRGNLLAKHDRRAVLGDESLPSRPEMFG